MIIVSCVGGGTIRARESSGERVVDCCIAGSIDGGSGHSVQFG